MIGCRDSWILCEGFLAGNLADSQFPLCHWLRRMDGYRSGAFEAEVLWLPEPQNDFIFAIICEELGFVGALIIIILFILLVWREVDFPACQG